MSKWLDALGIIGSSFQIGLGNTVAPALRRIRFRSGFTADLEWTATANRTITLPDASGTIALVANRKVGMLCAYTGQEGNAAGYFDDFDGKWVYLTLDSIRTIGNPSSGADIAASWTQTLFEHLWGQYDNTRCPLFTSTGTSASRGASATNDFNANRRITLPDLRGRVIGGCGTGDSLSLRLRGSLVGAETHTLTINETPEHAHIAPFTGGTAVNPTTVFAPATARGTTSPGPATSTTGGGQAHNNMQPTAFEHWVIAAGAR